MIYISEYISPVGKIFLESYDGENLSGLNFNYDKKDNIIIENDLDVFFIVKDWLNRYFRGENPDVSCLPLKLSGSSFRQLIWKFLLEIPYGKTTTYGALAKKAAMAMGKSVMSAQAVGNAVKNNPIAIIIPCHRVVAQNGLGGYNWGVERKIYLLKLEKV